MTEVTRGEFDMLKEMVSISNIRMESIDNHGTRGVAVIQEQVTELIKDLTELKVTSESWQTKHGEEHKTDLRNRITGRRWLIGMGVTGIGAMGGLIALVLQLLSRVHG